MDYETLIDDVAELSGLHTEVVRRVLFFLPDALMEMEVGETVRTPLGVFRMAQTHSRPITLPDRKSTAVVSAKIVARLKPGMRLIIED